MMPLYFAYGSNLEVVQMQTRCRGSRMLSPGSLRGFRLDFTFYSSGWGCGVADIVSNEVSEVWGLVYKLTTSGLGDLDRYEGYPDAYTRFLVTINMEKEVLQNVWAYTVVEKNEFIAPSSDYLDIIKRAAAEYQFPEDYRAMLEQIPVS